MNESKKYLEEQIITYLGNKRSLLGLIDKGITYVQEELGNEKLSTLDLFSGSGIVARYLKQYSYLVIANDLEPYSKIINECYLTNKDDVDLKEIKGYIDKIKYKIDDMGLQRGFITELYSPKDDNNIVAGDRAFFTNRNAMLIDTIRVLIDEVVPEDKRKYLIAPLLSEVSVHNNTAGIFKGFYKNRFGIGQFGGEARNALKRILGEIELREPILSNFNSKSIVYQEDANKLVRQLDEVDVCYIDPPYNQHPYGSNYFMLNLVNEYQRPSEISRVSGIPKDWNRSNYNKSKPAKMSLLDVVQKVKAKFVLISFNSEGFITKEELENCLKAFGKLQVIEQKYNTFRGSRNLSGRSAHVSEYLFILDKRGK